MLLAAVAAGGAAPAASGAPALQPADPRAGIGTAWGLPALEPALILPPHAAALGSIVAASTLLLLFAYRRRPYVLFWVGAWLVNALAQYLTAEGFGRAGLGSILVGLAQFLGIASGLLFVLSADRYRQRSIVPRRFLRGLLPLLIWFGLAPAGLPDIRAVLVPGYVLGGAVFAAAGGAYLTIMRQARLLGAGLVGTALTLVGATSGWMAIALLQVDAGILLPRHILAISGLLHTFAALGMHLMVFEEMTYELRLINRRLALAQSELRQLVITDPLTGCHNRRFFDEVIRREHQRQLRYRIPLSFIFVDVDRFKAINDSLGHEAGDRVLRGVADFLRKHVREADYVFRWGGDEFLIMISCRLDEARRKAAALKAAFASSAAVRDLPGGVGLSLGCAEVPHGAGNAADYVEVADERMYDDKASAPPLRREDGRRA